MGKFLVKRLSTAVLTLLLALTLIFFMVRAIPGSPVSALIGTEQGITDEDYERMAERYGLTGTTVSQYVNYLKAVVSGDWGDSYFMGQPVFTCIASRLEPTLMLTLVSMLITILVGVPIGIFSATHENKLSDYIASSASVIFICIPNFVVGLALTYLLCFKLGWFPLSNYYWIKEYGLWQAIYSLIVPGLSLGLINAASTARYTRTAMISVMKRDYIRTARAKGLSFGKVRYVHALKNAFGTVMTTLGGALLGCLGGSVIIENLFNIPGVGRLATLALSQRDYTLLQADVLMMTLLFIIINILIDIGYKLLDPRIELN